MHHGLLADRRTSYGKVPWRLKPRRKKKSSLFGAALEALLHPKIPFGIALVIAAAILAWLLVRLLCFSIRRFRFCDASLLVRQFFFQKLDSLREG